jgi:hypothetical protein
MATFTHYTQGVTILARTNGAAFDFRSIDLAPTSTESGPIEFQGYRGLDQVVAQTAHLPGEAGFSSYEFVSFTNLTEVRWSRSPAHEFANVQVQLDTNAAAAQAMLHFHILYATNAQGQVLHYGRMDASGLQPGATYSLEETTNFVNWRHVAGIYFSPGTFQKPFREVFLMHQQPRFFRLRPE